MKKYHTLLLFLLLCGVQRLNANIVLPAIFGNGMVLQQKENVKIWGKAKINTNVLISSSCSTKTYTVKTDAFGNWKAIVATPAAGGPYTLTFNDRATCILNDVLIGEVGLYSG